MQNELLLNVLDDFTNVVVGEFVDKLSLTGSDVSANEDLEFRLSGIKGLERISILVVEKESGLINLRFIKVMPSLEVIFLYGRKLESIDGIELLSMVKYIEIDFGKKKRSLMALREATVEKLAIWSPSLNDIAAISNSKTISELELYNCKENLVLESLTKIPLKHLRLEKLKIEELGDFKQLAQLESLVLLNCNKFKRFQGINSSVELLIIEACNNVDIMSINVFRGLKSINLVNIKPVIMLSDLLELDKLSHISIQSCSVQIDICEIKDKVPMIEELWISGMKKEKTLNLSKNNPNIVMSNGVHAYKNGLELDINDYE